MGLQRPTSLANKLRVRGARYVGIVQSLLASCRSQGVDPYVYLIDVLQRIDSHPAFEVHLLIPRLWKQHFAATLLRSALDRRGPQRCRLLSTEAPETRASAGEAAG